VQFSHLNGELRNKKDVNFITPLCCRLQQQPM
jgi:hypothetical protein